MVMKTDASILIHALQELICKAQGAGVHHHRFKKDIRIYVSVEKGTRVLMVHIVSIAFYHIFLTSIMLWVPLAVALRGHHRLGVEGSARGGGREWGKG